MSKITWMAVVMGLTGIVSMAMAKESKVPASAFRTYFWGARKAYEDRDFKKAEHLLRTYREYGSPPDRLLKAAGCDTQWEVDLFTKALAETRACFSHRPKSLHWVDAERAKFAVTMALRSGDVASLEPYVDCAPIDLTAQITTCGAHSYRQPADLERLFITLKKSPNILEWPNWREIPRQSVDEKNIRWKLHTASDHWKPCGMQGAALISLREEPKGEYRIAGFAAGCLESL